MSDTQAMIDRFMLAWEEFGDDKSTEFLVQVTADRLGVDPADVYEALASIHDPAPPRRRKPMTESFLTKWERVIKTRRTDGIHRKTEGRPLAWSSGRDEDFGGRFFCFHGLSEQEHEALKALADKGLGVREIP